MCVSLKIIIVISLCLSIIVSFFIHLIPNWFKLIFFSTSRFFFYVCLLPSLTIFCFVYILFQSVCLRFFIPSLKILLIFFLFILLCIFSVWFFFFLHASAGFVYLLFVAVFFFFWFALNHHFLSYFFIHPFYLTPAIFFALFFLTSFPASFV